MARQKKINLQEAILKAVAFAAKVNSEIARENGKLAEDEQYVYVAPHFRLSDGSMSIRDDVMLGVQTGAISGVFSTKADLPEDENWYQSGDARQIFTETCIELEETGKLQKTWIRARENSQGRVIPGYYALKIAGTTRSKSGKREARKPQRESNLEKFL